MIDAADAPGKWRGYNILVVSPTPTHPQDHGNRKRIFEVCQALKAGGAKIHFVHYPAEHDWRHARPRAFEDQMKAAWDSYQLVAPSRELHTAAAGEDHLIDEWADPNLASYLRWACRVQTFDVAIVNYTWMSFCFDAIPGSVFKICDTHDVFSDRRKLLESHGIAAEFFHTTPSEEAKGLARADLVWAIKESEQAYFEKDLGLPNCLTLLHAEPERDWWTSPPSQDGWLRAGVMGARNNINRRNLEQFLQEALPKIESYMAPVKIVIGGGVADDFVGYNHPNVEILGRVPEVRDFYAQVDVILAPIQFSTGLKIKVAEALSSGAPLLALAHASEGFPCCEPYHHLESFAAMAFELVKLAFDRAELPGIAAASRAAAARIRTSVGVALEATRGEIVRASCDTLCVIAPMEALNVNSVLCDHLLAALDYMRFTSKLAVYVHGPAGPWTAGVLDRFDFPIRVYADPILVRDLGRQAPESWTPIDFSDLLDSRGFDRTYLMSDFDLPAQIRGGQLRQALVRHDAVALAGGDPDKVIESLRRSTPVIVLGSGHATIARWQGAAGVVEVVEAPYRRTGLFGSLLPRRGGGADARVIVAMGARNHPLIPGLSDLVQRLGARLTVIDPHDVATSEGLRLSAGAHRGHNPRDALAQAALLVDFTEGDALGRVVREALQRAGAPAISFLHGRLAIDLHLGASPLFVCSPRALLKAVAGFLADDEAGHEIEEASRRSAAATFDSDAGWTRLWTLLRQHDPKPKPGKIEAAEALFG